MPVRLTRIHAQLALEEGALVALPAPAALHVARVLRLGPGAPIAIFNGEGSEYSARVEQVRGAEVSVRVGARAPLALAPALRLTLVQGISRTERMDFAIQKATELGVERIVPLKADHAVVRLNDESAAKKRAHWQGVAIAACEQCGRARLPRIESPLTLPDWLALERGESAAGARLVLDPGAPAGLKGLEASHAITLLIGPEGGLSPAELALAATQGYRPVRLGPRILRTETAAIAALAALQTLYGDLAE